MHAVALALIAAFAAAQSPSLEQAYVSGRELIRSAPTTAQSEGRWTEGSFASADGARIHYRKRAGAGPAILLIHGWEVGPELFDRVSATLFPGRAMVVLGRRGYSPSQAGDADETSIGTLNAQDVARAMRVAAAAGGTPRVGVVAVSLGALLLPPLDKTNTAWLALISPGAPKLARYMGVVDRTFAEATNATYLASRFWLPYAREAWLYSIAKTLVEDFAKQVQENANDSNRDLLEAWVRRAQSRLGEPRWRELFIQESLYAGFGDARFAVAPEVPVFAAHGDKDTTVPDAAFGALCSALGDRARLKIYHMPGGHMTPMLDPSQFAPALEAFERGLASPD